MILKSVRLKNFKKHEDLTVDLAEGLTVVRGPNWAGKSTVLQAVLFALFGPSAVPGKKDGLTRRGGGKMSVTLQFDEYELERTNSTALLTSGGKTVASSASAVDAWLSQHLSVDRKVALSLCYSPQTHTSALLTLGVGALNSLVEKVSRAEDVEQLAARASEKAQEAKKGVPSDMDELPAQLEALESDLAVRVADQHDLQSQEALAKDVLASSNKALEEAMASLSGAMEAETRRKVALERHRQNQEAVDALASAVKPEATKPLEARISTLSTQVAEAKAAETRRAALVKWFHTTGKQWQEWEPNVSLLKEACAELERAESQLAPLQAEFSDACAQVKIAQAAYEAAKHACTSSSCPTCKRDYEGVDKGSLEAASQKAEKELEKASLARMVSERNLSEVKSSVDSLKSQVESLSKKVPPSDYEATFQEKVDELESIPSSNDLTEDEQHLERSKQALSKLQREHAQYDALVRAASNLQDDTGWDELAHDLDSYKSAVAHLTKAEAEARSVWNGVSLEVSRMEAEVRALANHADSLKAKIESSKAAQVRASRFDQLAKWLRKSKAQFLQDLWDGILADASDVLNEASEGFATGLRRGEDGEFQVEEDGEWVPASAISGGMAAIAGTALKVSLPSEAGFVLLDEPSSELNDARALALASALKTVNRQVVIVTHREGEEYLADQLVELT